MIARRPLLGALAAGPAAWCLPEAARAELDRLLAADDWPGLARLAATGALLPLGDVDGMARAAIGLLDPSRWATVSAAARPPAVAITVPSAPSARTRLRVCARKVPKSL